MKKIKLFFIAFLWVCLWLTSFSSALQNSFFRFWLVDSNDNFITSETESLFVPWNTYRLGYTVWYFDNQWNTVFPIQSVVSSNSNWNPMPRYTLGWMSDMFFDFWGSIVINWNSCQYNSVNILSWDTIYNQIWVSVSYPNYSPALFTSWFVIDSSNYRKYVWKVVFTNACDFSINTTQDMDFWLVSFLFSFYHESTLFAYLNNNYTAYSWGSVDCSQDSNYRQCLEDKNLLIWQVSTLSWSLTSCQSDLCVWVVSIIRRPKEIKFITYQFSRSWRIFKTFL